MGCLLCLDDHGRVTGLKAQGDGTPPAHHADVSVASCVRHAQPAEVVAWTLPEVVVTALATLSSMLISVAFISATTAAMQSMDAKTLGRRHRMEEMAQYLAFRRVGRLSCRRLSCRRLTRRLTRKRPEPHLATPPLTSWPRFFSSPPCSVQVPARIVSRILDFYEYYNSSSFGRTGEFSQLPFDLAMTLNVHLYKELLRKCPVFYNISTEAMLQLLSEMRMSVATPYHIVVHEGQPNHNLYFIHRGHVRVWKNFDDDRTRHARTRARPRPRWLAACCPLGGQAGWLAGGQPLAADGLPFWMAARGREAARDLWKIHSLPKT